MTRALQICSHTLNTLFILSHLKYTVYTVTVGTAVYIRLCSDTADTTVYIVIVDTAVHTVSLEHIYRVTL